MLENDLRIAGEAVKFEGLREGRELESAGLFALQSHRCQAFELAIEFSYTRIQILVLSNLVSTCTAEPHKQYGRMHSTPTRTTLWYDVFGGVVVVWNSYYYYYYYYVLVS